MADNIKVTMVRTSFLTEDQKKALPKAFQNSDAIPYSILQENKIYLKPSQNCSSAFFTANKSDLSKAFFADTDDNHYEYDMSAGNISNKALSQPSQKTKNTSNTSKTSTSIPKEKQETLKKETIQTLEMLFESGKQSLETQDKEDGFIAKAANSIREFFGGKATKKNVEKQLETQNKFINDLKKADTPEKFAKIYKENTGVEYNPEKIQKFVEAKQYSTIAQAGLNKCAAFQEEFKKRTSITSGELIDLTKKFYNCSQEEAIAKLNEYAKTRDGDRITYRFDKDGNIKITETYVYEVKGRPGVAPREAKQRSLVCKPNEKINAMVTAHNRYDSMDYINIASEFSDFAKNATTEFAQNYKKTTGMSIEETAEKYTKYAKEAFGTSGFNGELVKEYCQKQETVADRVASGVSIAGMGLMVTGYAAAPVTGGSSLIVAQIGTGMAIGGTFLDEGLDLVDELTSENGLTKEEGLALLKETTTDAALVSSGFGINVVSNGVNQVVLTKMGSKILAKTVEVGVDAGLGLLSDAIITGDIDLKGEGLSQAISIIAGISAAKTKTKIKPSTKAVEPQKFQTSNPKDINIDGTKIANPEKTAYQPPSKPTKKVSDMSILEKTARGIDNPQKIITPDSTAKTQKIIDPSQPDVKNKSKIITNETIGEKTIEYKETSNGYKSTEKIDNYPERYEKNTTYNAKENTFTYKETETSFKSFEQASRFETDTKRKYSSSGAIESETITKTYYGSDPNKILGQELTSTDYVHNSTITAKYSGSDPEYRVLQSQTRTYKNPSTGKTETHVMELSDVAGVYNSKIIDSKGNTKIECEAVKKPDGSVRVEKNLEGLNGTKTHQIYEASANEDVIKTFYQVIDKKGKVLSTTDREFTRLSPDFARSSINGYEYTMRKTDKGIEVTEVAAGKTTFVEYEKIIESSYDGYRNMHELLDKMSGDQILDIYNRNIKIGAIDRNYAYFDGINRQLKTSNDMFTASHELGHGKDISNHSSKDGIISNDANFRKTFEKEKAAFKKAFPDVQEDYIDYFIKGPWNDADIGAGETVAEMNAILSTGTGRQDLAIRTYYIQKYFPETLAEVAKQTNPHSNIAIEKGTKLDSSAHDKASKSTNSDSAKRRFYDKAQTASSVPEAVSAKLRNFGIDTAEYQKAVSLYGETEAGKYVELLGQLRDLNLFRDAKLTLEDAPKMYELIKGRAENTIDFNPENLLSKYEKSLNEEARFEIEIKRDIDFETAQKIYKSLNADYTRAVNEKYMTDIGSSKGIICQEPEISKAKIVTPENPTKFTEILIESNMVTDKLMKSYKNMLQSNDVRAKEIADRVNAKKLVLTDNSGLEEVVSFSDLMQKYETNPQNLTSSEIHAITDTFKNEVRVNKASSEFFDKFLNAEITQGGEFLPEYKQIAGSVKAMQDLSKPILGNDIEITEHALMRLIDRDLINPTDINGNLTDFRSLMAITKNTVTEAAKADKLKGVVLKNIFSSEGKEISLIIKRTENGKIRIESFM